MSGKKHQEISCKRKQLSDRDLVDDVTESLNNIFTRPVVENCRKVGVKRSGGSGRPINIKVTLQSTHVVQQELRKSNSFKSILIPGYSFMFNKLYLSPDRTEEERKHVKSLPRKLRRK